MEKTNIILDLDECCVHSVLYSDIKNINKNNFRIYKKKLKSLGIYVDVFNYKFLNNKTEVSMTFRRPYLKQFFSYLFKNYNVSVWSNGYYTYVYEVCKKIFTPLQFKNLNYIFGASLKGVYDILNKKILYSYLDTHNKNLKYLFNNKPYSNFFNKNNTILIDNDKTHYLFNKKKNVLLVKEWFFNNYDDTILLNIIEYLKSNKVNLLKLKTFLRQKKSLKKSLKK